MRERILLTADELFVKYGVKSVTMDEIAKQLSISKKTIYQYFKNKNELVKVFTLRQCEQRNEDFQRIPRETKNSIEALITASKCIKESIVEMNPSLLMDIKKYYKEAWQIFEEFKESTFYKSIQETIDRGIEEGYFRKDINSTIISIMRMQQIQDCFNSKIYPREKFEYKEVQIQLLNHFMYGLLTSKGIALLEKYINDNSMGDVSL